MNYTDIIQKTAVFPKQVNDFSLAYFTLGLFDELSEYYDALIENSSDMAIIKEAGDVCWYACGIANHLELDFMELVNNRQKDKSLNPFLLLGLVKKHYRDNKELDKEQVSKILKIILYECMEGHDPELILRTNYEKLIDRLERNAIQGSGDNR